MALEHRLSMMSITLDSEVVEDAAPNDVSHKRGKAKGLAVNKYKKMNNNQKPRVEFRQGLLKPVGMWAKKFASEAARIVRMNAPLACHNWKKVKVQVKKDLHACILESFDVDLHVPHVRRAVNHFIGQRLRSFRNTLYKHYKRIPIGKDKQQYPHEDVQQDDWIGLCAYFESDKFKKLSAKNTESRKKQTVNH